MSSQGNVYTHILVIVHILTPKYKRHGQNFKHTQKTVNVHTLVKCTYGREALRDEDTHGMKSKLFGVEGNQRNCDVIPKIKSLHSVKGRHGGDILHDGVIIFKAAGVCVCGFGGILQQEMQPN